MRVIQALITALRPIQWMKNLLVLAAPTFALATDLEVWRVVASTFVIFCFISSSTYLVNDLFDVEHDRRHPVKKNRPIASGALPFPVAVATAIFLFAVGVIWAFAISLGLGLVITSYLLAQLLYNLKFKHVLILDIMTLASGFVLRAVAGGVAARVPISPWFLFCVALLAFYIGLEKRKSELGRVLESGVNTRKILEEYTLEFLTQVETAVLACILLAYTLWTIQGASTEWMMLSVPFVLYGILRYQYLSQRHIVERPEEAVLQDLPLLINGILWGVTSVVILALNR